MDNIEKKLDMDSLPTLPTVYQALMEKLEDPKATINDVSNTIILDISSTTKLLQLVNSSIFSFKNRVDTVSQAISLLGFNEVRNTILAIAITDYFRSYKKDKDFMNLDLWQHSIATGIIAKIIAKEIGVKKPETLFISGLLHDVGKLVLITNFRQDYFDLLFYRAIEEEKLNKLEKMKFKYSHDEIGSMLVKKWRISDEIAEPIRCHHSINFDSPYVLNISIVYLANILAKMLELGKSGNLLVEKPDNRIWDILKLRPGFLKSLYYEIDKQYYESSSLLKL